jgi:hypothetical protein
MSALDVPPAKRVKLNADDFPQILQNIENDIQQALNYTQSIKKHITVHKTSAESLQGIYLFIYLN